MKALFLILFFALTLQANTYKMKEFTCPIDSNTFEYQVAMSGSSFGQRLDLKQTGAIDSPWPVPTCTKCGFPLLRDTLSVDEIQKYKKIVFSEEFKGYVKSNESTYYLLATLFRLSNEDHNIIAYKYLQASWQIESDSIKYEKYVREALFHYQSFFCSGKVLNDNNKFNTLFLNGELYRRMGNFQLSSLIFKIVNYHYAHRYDPLINQELFLIQKKNSDPQIIGRTKL